MYRMCNYTAIASAGDDTSEAAENSHFRFVSLPPEIQHQIFSLYFSTLAPLELTTTNAAQSMHLKTALPLSLALSVPRHLYYAHATFSISSSAPLTLIPPWARTKIRRVRISYRILGSNSMDWVYILNAALPSLTEVVFVVELMRLGAMVREGWCERVKEVMKESILTRQNRGVLLRIECGMWGNEEWIGKK